MGVVYMSSEPVEVEIVHNEINAHNQGVVEMLGDAPSTRTRRIADNQMNTGPDDSAVSISLDRRGGTTGTTIEGNTIRTAGWGIESKSTKPLSELVGGSPSIRHNNILAAHRPVDSFTMPTTRRHRIGHLPGTSAARSLLCARA
ncbi:MAG: hypothetical protein HY904_14600 [Deltaproteobacteria bacterium]|nr:hypothetical protein [Deltaproteobacteria bacterium]